MRPFLGEMREAELKRERQLKPTETPAMIVIPKKILTKPPNKLWKKVEKRKNREEVEEAGNARKRREVELGQEEQAKKIPWKCGRRKKGVP